MVDAAAELHNKQFEKYYDKYEKLSDVEKNKLNLKFKPINLILEAYEYKGYFTEEESDDKTLKGDEEEIADLSSMPPLEKDEEVK